MSDSGRDLPPASPTDDNEGTEGPETQPMQKEGDPPTEDVGVGPDHALEPDLAQPIDLQGDRADAALHAAAREGDADACAALLSANCPVDQPNEDGWTALHVAAHEGHAGVVALLLAQNADPAALTKSGRQSAYELALVAGRLGAVEALEGAVAPDLRVAGRKAAMEKIEALSAELACVKQEKEALQKAIAAPQAKVKTDDEATEEKIAESENREGGSPEHEARKDEEKQDEGNEGEDKEEAGKDEGTKGKKRKSKKKKEHQEPHEIAADALDNSLQTFKTNTERLEKVLAEKQAEVEEAEGLEYGPEPTELYANRLMELYTLSPSDLTVPSKRGSPPSGEPTLVLRGEHHGIPVTVLAIPGALYHPYFHARLAHHVAYLGTTGHPNLALFIGLAFLPRPAEGGKKKKAPDPPPEPEASLTAPPKDAEVVLVYENFAPTALDVLRKGEALPAKALLEVAAGLVAALAYLHRRNHVHGSICSSTVLVDVSAPRAKLSHFGVAVLVSGMRKLKGARPAARWYFAPELLLDAGTKKGGAPAVDIPGAPQDMYSLGMVLLALCTMKEDHGKPADLIKGVKLAGLRDLLFLLTKPRPGDRLTAAQAAAHLRALRPLPEYA